MADKAWKAFERESAALFGATRKPANSGHRVDFESGVVVGQCKLVKELSLEALTQLVEEMDAKAGESSRLGVVTVKRRRGRGHPSPGLVVMSFGMWKLMQIRATIMGGSGGDPQTPNR